MLSDKTLTSHHTMKKGKGILLVMRCLIIKLRHDGKSVDRIGIKNVDKPHSSIPRIIQIFLDSRNLSLRPRCGREKKLSVREEIKIIRKIKVIQHFATNRGRTEGNVQ